MKQRFVLFVTILNVTAALLWVSVGAQQSMPPKTPLPAPQQPFVLTQADIRHMLEANKEDTSLGSVDAGKHVVDVWLDQRNANPGGERAGQAHAELTEIYVIQRGAATMKAGGRITAPQFNETLPKRVSPGGAMFVTPTWGGPADGGRTFDVGVGDIVVLPPGTVHQWTSIPQEMRYIILRIDPEHRQKAGFVQPLLKR
jgi:mannose-6-phosphate isomerase-like protein (cupin superfamily)